MSVYAASGISGSDPMKIVIYAVRIGIAGFIIFYIYWHNPALILIGSVSKMEFSTTVTLLCICIIALSFVLECHFLIKLPLFI